MNDGNYFFAYAHIFMYMTIQIINKNLIFYYNRVGQDTKVQFKFEQLYCQNHTNYIATNDIYQTNNYPTMYSKTSN